MVWKASSQSSQWNASSQSATVGAFAVLSVSAATVQPDDSLTFTVENATGSLEVTDVGGAGPVAYTARDASSITIDAPHLQTLGSAGSQIKYGTHTVTLSDGTSTATYDITFSPVDAYTQDVLASVAVDGLYDEAGLSGVENGVDVALGGVTSGNDGDLSAAIDKTTGAYSVGDTAFQYSVYFYDDSEARWYGDGPSQDATAPIVISVPAPAVSPIPVIVHLLNMMRAA